MSKKISVDSKKKFTQEVEIILDEDNLDVVDTESMPTTLPTHVNWVSYFKVVKKPGKPVTKRTYKIRLKKQAGTLVASYDNTTYVTLTTTTVDEVNEIIEASLSEDDPAIGWVG